MIWSDSGQLVQLDCKQVSQWKGHDYRAGELLYTQSKLVIRFVTKSWWVSNGSVFARAYTVPKRFGLLSRLSICPMLSLSHLYCHQKHIAKKTISQSRWIWLQHSRWSTETQTWSTHGVYITRMHTYQIQSSTNSSQYEDKDWQSVCLLKLSCAKDMLSNNVGGVIIYVICVLWCH